MSHFKFVYIIPNLLNSDFPELPNFPESPLPTSEPGYTSPGTIAP
jgi:hypothetical protein